MPELPEVETVRRGLASRLESFVIESVEVCRDRAIASPGGPSLFVEALQGTRVGAWKRRGKYLIANLHASTQELSTDDIADAGLWGVHLRMTGQFQWHPEPSSTCRHTRVRFWNPEGQELRFVDLRSFGEMWWVPPGEPAEHVMTGLRTLGPEPFDDAFSAAYLKQKLKGSSRSIKAALLDQAVVAGAGNIYADESLFASGIAPQTRAGSLCLQQLQQLRDALVQVLEISIGVGGTTFSDFRDLEGVNGNYGGQASVYRRTGQSCSRCGGTIQREKLAGRSTHWCPGCQH